MEKEQQISLAEMLDARERRVRRREQLTAAFHSTLISFTMNIAGPVKTSSLIRRGFQAGKASVRRELRGAGIAVLHFEETEAPTGSEAFFVVDGAPDAVKALTVGIEELHPIGRLFDLDVFTPEGTQASRSALEKPERACLICGRPAKGCASRRIHNVEELQRATTRLLRTCFEREDAQTAASLACRSLLYEVCTTPKPGLVDQDNSGSHRDMDIFTFLSSVSALYPYFETCTMIGMHTTELPPRETFRQLQWAGRQAEEAMERATDGVNTHKGAIFSMGILCGALGRLPGEQWRDGETVLRECARMTEGLTERAFAHTTAENAATAGQRIYVRYGITGIRGEAEGGFPAVRHAGLPRLEQGLAMGLSLHQAGCAALLALIAESDDTNLIARSSRETQLRVREQIRRLLEETPFPDRDTLKRLDDAFIRENLSPGGSADLLAMTYMLYFLKRL